MLYHSSPRITLLSPLPMPSRAILSPVAIFFASIPSASAVGKAAEPVLPVKATGLVRLRSPGSFGLRPWALSHASGMPSRSRSQWFGLLVAVLDRDTLVPQRNAFAGRGLTGDSQIAFFLDGQGAFQADCSGYLEYDRPEPRQRATTADLLILPCLRTLRNLRRKHVWHARWDCEVGLDPDR